MLEKKSWHYSGFLFDGIIAAFRSWRQSRYWEVLEKVHIVKNKSFLYWNIAYPWSACTLCSSGPHLRGENSRHVDFLLAPDINTLIFKQECLVLCWTVKNGAGNHSLKSRVCGELSVPQATFLGLFLPCGTANLWMWNGDVAGGTRKGPSTHQREQKVAKKDAPGARNPM